MQEDQSPPKIDEACEWGFFLFPLHRVWLQERRHIVVVVAVAGFVVVVVEDRWRWGESSSRN